MAINMMCMNSECKHYFEDNCMRNIQEERIVINSYGQCKTFEKGVSECYQLFEEEPKADKSSYEKIEDFIKENRYTYKVENILESYEKYWLKGAYTSYTMTHCIENLENEIKDLRN